MKHTFKVTQFILLLVILNVLRITAQGDSKISGYLPNYATVAPGNLYNGQPDINIPLYTLKGRGISIPISLSYDASGITVHQEATSVGLGWVLNAGGHIIQETKHLYDMAGKPRITNDYDAGRQIWYDAFDLPVPWEQLPVEPETHDVYLDFVCDNLPDVYYYNFNGNSGKFILDRNLISGITIPKNTLKIERVETETECYFNIIDDGGTLYRFDLKKWIGPVNNRNTESIIFQLTSILTPQFDTIEFEYESIDYYKRELNSVYEDITYEYYQSVTQKIMPLFLVKRISVRGGESVEFEFGNRRMDVYAVSGVPTIKKVKLLDANGTTKKQYELFHSYFTSDPFLQYLPQIKLDTTNYYITNIKHLPGTYNIKQTDGTYKLYTNVQGFDYPIPSFPATRESYEHKLYGYYNGQRVEMENCYGVGNYVFTVHNDTVFVVLNNESLINNLPPFPELFPFKCQTEVSNTIPCTQQWEDYKKYLQDYNRSKSMYLGETVSQPMHYQQKVAGGMYYFAVNTEIINTLFTFYENRQFPQYPNFRPFYKSNMRSLKLRLDSIKEYSSNQLLANPSISFEYNPTKLPHEYSSDFDHWGYYNYREGKPNITPVPDYNNLLYPTNRSVFNVSNDINLNEEPNRALYSGYRLPNEAKMKACVLEKITNGNGAYTKYTYEANRARTSSSGAESDIVGGLRIKSIETGNSDGQKYFSTYEYKVYTESKVNGIYTISNTDIHSGYLHASEVQYRIGKRVFTNTGGYFKYVNGIPSWVPFAEYKVDYLGVMNSAMPLIKTKNGTVGYSHVSVKQEDALGNNLGVTLYKFFANSPLEYIPFTLCGPDQDNKYENFFKYLRPTEPSDPLLGTLQEKIIADKEGKILSKTQNEYCLTTPNFPGNCAPESKFLSYNHSYSGEISGGFTYQTYLTSNNPAYSYLRHIAPWVPKLSAVRNIYFFPNEGKITADSSFYLYDVDNCIFMSNSDYPTESFFSDGTYDSSCPINVSPTETYIPSLDAYYSTDYGKQYGFKVFNTQQILEELRFNNNGDQIRTRYWYPPHMADSDPVFAKMIAKNMISSPVHVAKFINHKQLAGTKTQYAVFSKEGSTAEDFLLPSETSVFRGNTYEPVKQFTKYSDGGLLKEGIAVNGNPSAIIWNYNKSLPIANVENANFQQIAYTSFENSTTINSNTDLNNWQVSASATWVVNTLQKITGSQSVGCNSDNVTISTQNNMPAGTYKLSFWARNFTSNLNGIITVGNLAPLTGNTWQLYSTTITLATAQKITLTLYKSLIDELRLYPAGAQMTTSTYDPINGVTSETDANNITTYYEYDELGKLLRIKDQDGNVRKENLYHYQGQN